MLIHNKRLHPRRPCEPGEHYHGCMLHELQEQSINVRNSKSPVNRSRTPLSQYSSSSLQSQRRQRQYSTSSSNSTLHSPRTQTPLNWKLLTDSGNKRYSLGAIPSTYDQINGLFHDAVDSPSKPSLKSGSSAKQKSKSTICLNSSLITATEIGVKPDKRTNTVTFKCYDSPDEIIANLFPGIDDDKDPKYLRKGHGAAQMLKNRSTQRDWPSIRSSSATGNYAPSIDNRKMRTFSTSSDNNGYNKDRQRYGRLYGIERDFDNLWCVMGVNCVYDV